MRTDQYGEMPWYGPCLAWIKSPQDRQWIYAVTKAAGDTHCIIHVPNGEALYDEPSQFYNATRFPALDWTNGLTAMIPAFTALVEEVIRAGFVPLLNMDERYEQSSKIMPLVLRALKAHPADLTRYVITLPGYDGVFYGWTREQVKAWSDLARSIAPDCYLGLEHSTGHIPMGEGGDDFKPGGVLQGFDVILSEFDRDLRADTVWQIAGRLLGPAYRRPADQPAGDDPHPPAYLAPGTPRGPYYTCAFEWATYYWVRGHIDKAEVDEGRAYLKALGYSSFG